ncbi:Imm15 family immunity protein [Embleya hyalina]|uniref:Uncharacterized protein n=1 Tax=Embleya hyalina TaxID=516124 RepID=A0A401Z5Q0_9ACTN|nr:Imm15 family immunity protein [Embleya hyalina]GCE02190.1 hypothetical protein EHYA_09967 [Embleya hyalina]
MHVDPRFVPEFVDLIHCERLDDLDRFLGPVELFDELPLYSRFHQLAFLDSLSVGQKNRLLIRAAAAHLPRIVEHGRGHDFFCMLSVLSWDEWELGGLIEPAFWYTKPSNRPDPSDPRGILDYLRFRPPTSRYGLFVADALDHDPRYVIRDDSGTDPLTRRVYVMVGEW